jgi:hypothetical protein
MPLLDEAVERNIGQAKRPRNVVRSTKRYDGNRRSTSDASLRNLSYDPISTCDGDDIGRRIDCPVPIGVL